MVLFTFLPPFQRDFRIVSLSFLKVVKAPVLGRGLSVKELYPPVEPHLYFLKRRYPSRDGNEPFISLFDEDERRGRVDPKPCGKPGVVPKDDPLYLPAVCRLEIPQDPVLRPAVGSGGGVEIKEREIVPRGLYRALHV